MGNDYFQFKKFTVRQDRCAMKVGTDGVLLGAWVDLKNAHYLLDIGTGTGLIAIMAAQRNPNLEVDAIEIDPAACQQAKENVQACPWQDRIQLFEGRVQEYVTDRRYDVIVCNPPFFINSTKTPEINRTLARHCDTLSHPDLLDAADRLLGEEGRLSVILPVPEAEQFMEIVHSRKWFINKLTDVCPTPTKPPKRKLIEVSRIDKTIELDTIIVEVERHVFHQSCVRLTREFYLKL